MAIVLIVCIIVVLCTVLVGVMIVARNTSSSGPSRKDENAKVPAAKTTDETDPRGPAAKTTDETEKPHGKNIGEDPLTRDEVDEYVRENKMYTAYQAGVATFPFPEKGKGVLVPLQLGSLPRYASNVAPRYYFKDVGGNFITHAKVNPLPRIPIPMKSPPEEVVYFVSFTETPTRKLEGETEETYRTNKYDWPKYHDGLLFHGTTETTFDEIYRSIDPRVSQEMRGKHGIALMYQSNAIRGDCIVLKDDKMVKPKHKLYHQFPQNFHDSLVRWLVHPNGTPVLHVNFNYYKKPRVKMGMAINETEKSCDGFLQGDKRYKWDETYDYNQEWVKKGALDSFGISKDMMDAIPDIKRVTF